MLNVSLLYYSEFGRVSRIINDHQLWLGIGLNGLGREGEIVSRDLIGVECEEEVDSD